MPNMLSPRDIVSRPDHMDETVLHTIAVIFFRMRINRALCHYPHMSLKDNRIVKIILA